ncbi:unnamed protein product [Cercospora beticola]|nr:unnamed protein product [Cercospora beticola]
MPTGLQADMKTEIQGAHTLHIQFGKPCLRKSQASQATTHDVESEKENEREQKDKCISLTLTSSSPIIPPISSSIGTQPRSWPETPHGSCRFCKIFSEATARIFPLVGGLDES